MKKYILLSLLIFGNIFTKKIDAQNLNTIIEIYLDNKLDLFKQEPFNRSTFDVTFQKDAVIHNDIVKDYLKVTHPNNKDIVTTIHLNKRKHKYEELGYVYQLQVRQIIDGIKENNNQVNYYSDIVEFYVKNIANIRLDKFIYSNLGFSERLRISFYERLINLIDNANSLLKDITEQDIEKCSETISTGSYNKNLCTNYFINKQYIEFDLDGFEDWMSSDNSKEFFEKYVGYILNYSGSMLIENDYEFSTNDAVPRVPVIFDTFWNKDDAILFQIHKSFNETDYKDDLPDTSILKFLFEEINKSTPSNKYILSEENPFDQFRHQVEMLVLETYRTYFLGLPHYLTGLSTPSGTNLTDPVNIFIKFPSLSFFKPWIERLYSEFREADIIDKSFTLQDFKNELKDPKGRKLNYRTAVEVGWMPTDVTYERFNETYLWNDSLTIESFDYSLPSVWIQIEKKYDGDSGNITIDKTISFDELSEEFLKNYSNDPNKTLPKPFARKNKDILLIKENGSLFVPVNISESISKLFLVDTGASISMISHEDYVFLNYTNQVKELGQVEVQLASGTAFLKKIEVSSLKVGGHEISNIEVTVGDSRLLGTDLLDRLGNWRISNEKIVIE